MRPRSIQVAVDDRAESIGLEIVQLTRPAWQADGACREHPEISFFPAHARFAGPARAVCSGCLVQAECLVFALADPSVDGVWGGLTQRERETWRRFAEGRPRQPRRRRSRRELAVNRVIDLPR